MYTPIEKFRRGIEGVRAILKAHSLRYRIAVYSQGDVADFAEVSAPDVEFFLDMDAIRTMEELIEADILIMARGTFSYYSGLISEGITICDSGVPGPFCDRFSPNPEWIVCRPAGSFDEAAFERQLERLLDARSSRPQ
jgi:hypothetical protein